MPSGCDRLAVWHIECSRNYNMILISIQPFAPRKMLALAVTLICLSTASCFA